MDRFASKPKRIGIDARLYGPIGKGLGRYVQELVDNVLQSDEHNNYVVFLCRENFNDLKISNDRTKKILVSFRWYSLAEQILFPLYAWKERLDIFHFPHFNTPVFCRVKFVVTIHDLILTKFPSVRATTLGPIIYMIKKLGYRLAIWSAVKRAEKIITVSNFTKNDIVDNFKINPEKIIVTYNGVANLTVKSDTNEGNDKKTFLGYNINKNYLLYVGNAYPHKNLDGLINIYSKIKENKSDLKLVLVGKEDFFYNKIKNYAHTKGLWNEDDKDSSVIFTGFVSDGLLKLIYQNASAYVFPSFYEGFGLPPLEAMSNGCPVASSDKACMPEILGDAAIYFNPDNEVEAAAKILRLINDENMRHALIEKGRRQASKYSWRDCADKTLKIYNEI